MILCTDMFPLDSGTFSFFLAHMFCSYIFCATFHFCLIAVLDLHHCFQWPALNNYPLLYLNRSPSFWVKIFFIFLYTTFLRFFLVIQFATSISVTFHCHIVCFIYSGFLIFMVDITLVHFPFFKWFLFDTFCIHNIHSTLLLYQSSKLASLFKCICFSVHAFKV